MLERKAPVIIIGAGPAGLTAAYELVKKELPPIVLERGNKVGGLARTEEYKGYRFDIGGHRFYTKVKEVEQLWREMLKEKFLRVPRLSRIYYNGKFFRYPLNFLNILSNLGLLESARHGFSYLKARFNPIAREESFEHWVTNRFGERLYRAFFQAYTEKVWGIPCSQIHAEWAAQRIKGLSFTSAVSNALFKTNGSKSLIEEFDYPALGPGMMWEAFRQAVESKGGEVRLQTEVAQFKRRDSRIESIVANQDGKEIALTAEHFISSMPVSELVRKIEPLPPAEVIAAAGKLKYRAFILVGLIIRRQQVNDDNWIYVHTPAVKVGRIQNFKNWSAAMVADATKTHLGMEYFCDEGDDLWKQRDDELIALGKRELIELGLAIDEEIEDGFVVRQPNAYPVYDEEYRQHLRTIQNYLATLENLQTIGRSGLHRYNNQDHSMLTGILAVKNLFGEKHNLWEVNTERSYYEEFQSNGHKGSAR